MADERFEITKRWVLGEFESAVDKGCFVSIFINIFVQMIGRSLQGRHSCRRLRGDRFAKFVAFSRPADLLVTRALICLQT